MPEMGRAVRSFFREAGEPRKGDFFNEADSLEDGGGAEGGGACSYGGFLCWRFEVRQ